MTTVEVRSVRGGLELRVDGTLASVFRPGRTLTGVVWWALAAPVLLAPGRRRRVLLLGLGAGSVARAIRALDPDAQIVGVEIDRQVLSLARRHFGLGGLRAEVIRGDALAYLRRERRRFDVIVEDLFVGASRDVRKPDWLLTEGYTLIRGLLRDRGLVVSNTIHEMPQVVRACRPLGRVLSLDVRNYHNRIVVAGSTIPNAREVRRRLSGSPLLKRSVRRVSIRTRHPSGRAERRA